MTAVPGRLQESICWWSEKHAVKSRFSSMEADFEGFFFHCRFECKAGCFSIEVSRLHGNHVANWDIKDTTSNRPTILVVMFCWGKSLLIYRRIARYTMQRAGDLLNYQSKWKDAREFQRAIKVTLKLHGWFWWNELKSLMLRTGSGWQYW